MKNLPIYLQLPLISEKMKKFNIPPQMDFLNNVNIDPFVMYIFDFTHSLDRQDLVDIWQNLMPKISTTAEKQTKAIEHSVGVNYEFFGEYTKGKLPANIRWMVFKVKQRAASRYYDQVYEKKGSKLTDLVSEVTTDTAGPRSKIQYNWPYDFFSLVELVKIDASVEFSDVETDDNGNETVVPKVATEENARIQLDTLFPKGKK